MEFEINGRVVGVKLTYADLESLPEDGKRYELHEGEVFVTAAARPAHQRLSLNLARRLEDFAGPRNLGGVFEAVDVYFTEYTVYCPDLSFVSTAHADRVFEKFIRGAPDLVVEIVSPTTEVRDRGIKLQDYARCGVPEYWIFDGTRRTVDVFVLRRGRYELLGSLGEKDTLRSEVLPGLEIPLAQIWPEGHWKA